MSRSLHVEPLLPASRCCVVVHADVGGGTANVNWSADEMALVATGLVTRMSTVPAAWAGLTALIRVSLTTW